MLNSLMYEFPIDSDIKAMWYIKHVQNKWYSGHTKHKKVCFLQSGRLYFSNVKIFQNSYIS